VGARRAKPPGKILGIFRLEEAILALRKYVFSVF
jgi:hypothetical protein